MPGERHPCLFIYKRQGSNKPAQRSSHLGTDSTGIGPGSSHLLSFSKHTVTLQSLTYKATESWENLANLAEVRTSKQPVWILNPILSDSKLGSCKYNVLFGIWRKASDILFQNRRICWKRVSGTENLALLSCLWRHSRMRSVLDEGCSLAYSVSILYFSL